MRYIDADALKQRIKNNWYTDTEIGEDIDAEPTADVVEVVRCKDCKHRPTDTGGHNYGQEMEFPDDVCPCQVGDQWYSWMPKDNWFCADGERREDDGEEG